MDSSAVVAPPDVSSSNALNRINFGTYDGSGEVVHPDVVTFAEPWNGHRYWTAITPYPKSNTRFENPSIFVSEDGESWAVPAGATNPLFTTGRGYLSDPDMVFVPESQVLRLYYREVQNQRVMNRRMLHVADHVWLTTSADAVHWSAPQRVLTDTARFVVSPSIVRAPDGGWRMYAVDAGRDGCAARASRLVMRGSADGIAWSKAAPVSFSQPGFVPWHLDVQYVASRNEYWALVAAYASGGQGCTTTSLFLATSSDGVRWTSYPAPVLARGEIPQFSSAVYRSTFAYVTDDDVTIWFSGARIATPATGKVGAILAWSAAMTHTTANALLARAGNKSNAAPLSIAPSAGTHLAPATAVP